MSKILVGWHLHDGLGDGDVRAFIAEVRSRYQPLFASPLACQGLWGKRGGLIYLGPDPIPEREVHVEDERIVALSGQPSFTAVHADGSPDPVTARSLFGRLGRHASGDAGTAISQVSPPFTLCWFDRRADAFGAIHDGLGLDSCFIAETPRGLVLSNKCWCILRLLGDSPRLDAAAWRYWFSVGWFPDNSTPFANIRYLEAGAVVTADASGIRTRRERVLPRWLAPRDAAVRPLMEQAEQRFHQLIVTNRPAIGTYQADLTAGLDTRAIASVLIKERVPCHFSTGGARYSPDVIGARYIARAFDLHWTNVSHSVRVGRSQLAGNTADLQFKRMTLWGEGLVEPNRFAHFRVRPAGRQESLPISGGAAGISKGHFYRTALLRNPRQSYEACRLEFLDRYRVTAASILTPGACEELNAALERQVSEGGADGLASFHLLDAFYLAQRLKRWDSAHQAINLAGDSLLPFVNIEHITLGFAMSNEDKLARAFQHFVIARNAGSRLTVPARYQLYGRIHDRLRQEWARASVRFGWSSQMTWREHFRTRGSQYAEKAIRSAAPLAEILDVDQQRRTGGWVRRGTVDWFFYLRLVAFSYWYQQFMGASDDEDGLLADQK